MLDLGPIKFRMSNAQRLPMSMVYKAESGDDVPSLVAEIERLRAESTKVRAEALEDAGRYLQQLEEGGGFDGNYVGWLLNSASELRSKPKE